MCARLWTVPSPSTPQRWQHSLGRLLQHSPSPTDEDIYSVTMEAARGLEAAQALDERVLWEVALGSGTPMRRFVSQK